LGYSYGEGHHPAAPPKNMRKSMTISVTEDLRKFILDQTRAQHYNSVSDYIRSLIRKERIRCDRAPVRAEEPLILMTMNESLASDAWDHIDE
jgi:Arc/MetJ-type ribon-helix-helix transcriptional regulator